MPSHEPTPYTISRGWNARLLVRGVNGVVDSRGGGIVSPVVSDPSMRVVASECTSVRCVRQFVFISEDVLCAQAVSGGTARVEKDGDVRGKDFCLFVHVERGEPLGEQVPRLYGHVASAEVVEFDFPVGAVRQKACQ